MTISRVIAFLTPAVLIPFVAFAAVCNPNRSGGLDNPICATDLSTFLADLLGLIAVIALPIVALFLVYVGFLFISSQGNPEKLKEAKSYFLWAVVGALLVLGAQALSFAIRETVRAL